MRQSVYSTETLGAGSLSCFRLCFADRRTLRTTLRTASPPDFVCIPLRQRRHPQNFMCLGMRELPIALPTGRPSRQRTRICQRLGQAVSPEADPPKADSAAGRCWPVSSKSAGYYLSMSGSGSRDADPPEGRGLILANTPLPAGGSSLSPSVSGNSRQNLMAST